VGLRGRPTILAGLVMPPRTAGARGVVDGEQPVGERRRAPGRLVLVGGEAGVGRTALVRRSAVDHHVAAILRKLGVHTRTQAIREAAHLGLPRQDSQGAPS
jgi:hypothetical protein